jgi:DNA ligase-1
MPKQQSSLDSFFGVSNKVKKQKTVTPFFKKGATDDAANGKENDDNGVQRNTAAEAEAEAANRDEDDDDNDRLAKPRGSSIKNTKKRDSPDCDEKKASSLSRRRRLVIDDDSDDEENEFEGENKDVNKAPQTGDDAVQNEEVVMEDAESATAEVKQEIKSEPVVEDNADTDVVVSAAPSSFFMKAKRSVDKTTADKKADLKQETTADNATKKKVVQSDKKLASTTATTTNEKEEDSVTSGKDESDDAAAANESPGRRKLIKRAKKIAKDYNVEVEIKGDFPRPKAAPPSSKSKSNKKSNEPTDNGIVQYKDLVIVLDQIEATSGRLDIQALMTKFFRRIIKYGNLPDDLNAAVYLASNSVAPAYKCVELGIGDSLLIKAISEAYGSKPATVKTELTKMGDLGLVARSCKSRQRTLGFGVKPKPLTMGRILAVYREIAHISGSSSQRLKVDKIKRLLVAVQDSTETKFIIRGLQGKLRIGLAQSTVLVALAHALTMTVPASVQVPDDDNGNEEDNDDGDDGDEEKEISTWKIDKDPIVTALMDESLPVEKSLEASANMIRKVYSEVPSYDALLDAALSVPLINLNTACHFQPGIPVEPMLAKPTKSIQEVLKRLDGQEFTCEYKYDGERAQIHKTPDGTLKVFSRNLLETSGKYPEVPIFVQEAALAAVANRKKTGNDDDDEDNGGKPADSFVLDAEVVAYDHEKGQLVPFQILSTRKKTVEEGEKAKVQVIVQAFDLMYLNGKSLLSKTMKERRSLLHKHFAPVEGKFQFAKALDAVEDGDTIVLEQFLDAAVKGQCEGLMVKTMVDIYEPSRRSLNWLKLKKDYLDGVGDSFDLVPLGAYFGRGKRTGVYGAYLLACYDEDTEEFQSVCKIGTGFSDEDLQSLSASLNEHKLDGGKSSQYVVADTLEPDVWFDAVQVWEIKAADLSKSSTHRGAVGKLEEGRGIGLRFPRFERIRDDKRPDQATNSEQVLEMYYNQDSVKGQKGGEYYDDDGEI